MFAIEFIAILFWVLLPPLLIGLVLLFVAANRRDRISLRRRALGALTLIGVASLAAVILLIIGPPGPGIYIGVREVTFLGTRTIWAPLAFIAVVVAFPVALGAMRVGGSR
jgi:hypothetical protein